MQLIRIRSQRLSAAAAASLLVSAFAASACSSAPSLDERASEVARSKSAALSAAESVRLLRWPAIISASPRVFGVLGATALDSQNALPSGTLANSVLLQHLRQLATAGLNTSTGKSELSAIGNLSPELVRYLARCALPEGDSLLVSVGPPSSPVLLVEEGRLGLASSWRDSPLSPSEKGWITACLMAHSNNLGHVDIAVAGATPALSATSVPADPQPWKVEEAAFFGQLFDAVPGQRPFLFACSGVGTQKTCSDSGASADLERRICGNSTACGFQYLGPCNDIVGSSDACSLNMPYDSCVPAPAAPAVHEVITVYLKTDADHLGLHPSCGQQPSASCSHSVCSTGGPLAKGCSAGICKTDSYCCSAAWDESCVEQARSRGYCP